MLGMVRPQVCDYRSFAFALCNFCPCSRGTKAAGCAPGSVEAFCFDQLRTLDRCDDQLRNAHGAGDYKWLGTEIDQNDLHFAAIVGVDGSRRIQHSDAVARGEPRPRTNLTF